MPRTRLALAGAAVLAASALALAPAAATAHTDDLFTWAFQYTGDDSEIGGFATASKTDAALAFLGTDTVDTIEQVPGVEVCNGVGYAVGGVDGDVVVLTFDHSTGAILSGPTVLTLTGGAVVDIWELDTLADCTVLSIAQVSSDDLDGIAIISIDPTTGAVTPLVDVTPGQYLPTGIATTAAGVTYLFGDDSDYPAFATVDLATGTASAWVELDGLNTYYDSTGFSQGVDFDAVGGLWIVNGVDAEEEYHLTTFAAGADLATATPTDIGILPYYDTPAGLQINTPIPLAAEGAHAVQPQLAATGTELPLGVVLAAGILLVGGGMLLRRRTA